jgi:signal peptidase I
MSDALGDRPVKRRRNPILRVIQVLATVVVLVLVFLALFLAVSVRHGVDGQTSLFGRPIYSVGSGSMTPTFDTGDLIMDKSISATAAAHLHKGQIITFLATPDVGRASGLVITHRIYAVVPGQLVNGVSTVEYRTKGEANNAPDPGLVASSAILGVYQGVRVPFGGYVLSALHQQVTFVVLIMVVVVYFAEELVRRKWIALGVQDARRKQAQSNRPGEL